MQPPGVALALACLILLAGCAGSTDTSSSTSAPTDEATGPPAPETLTHIPWQTGEWWVHHWYLGKNDTDGFTVKVVVAGNASDGWILATDDPIDAAFHGAFVFPTLGRFPTIKVAAVVGENRWPWYQFPLVNGTWSDTLASRDGDGMQYSYPSTATVTTDGHAAQVELRGEGSLAARYDYDPELHWFSEALIYDAGAPSTPDDWDIRIVTEQHGYAYTGKAYESTGSVLLLYENVQAPGTVPAPTATFTMTPEHSKLLLLRVTFASAGAQETVVLDPNRDPATGIHRQEAYGADGQAVSTDLFTAIPGDWQVVSGGAGVATGSLVYAYGIVEREITV